MAAEIEQDVGGLTNNNVARAQKWWREGRVLTPGLAEEAHHCLLAAVPRPIPNRARSPVVTGELPRLLDPPPGCAFHTRCPHALPRCREAIPALRDVAAGHAAACHLHDA